MKNSDRHYDTPIGKLTSVTTYLQIINKPFLIPWVKKEAREATIEALSLEPESPIELPSDQASPA